MSASGGDYPGRLLAVDVGSVRVGIALSDPTATIAQPLTVIDCRREDVFARIHSLVAEHDVQHIVVGRPVTMAGVAGLAVQAVDAFVAQLRLHIQVPITFWDERLSTKAAERAMIEGNVRRDRRRGSIDKVAAALILQGFLDAGCPADSPTML